MRIAAAACLFLLLSCCTKSAGPGPEKSAKPSKAELVEKLRKDIDREKKRAVERNEKIDSILDR